MEKTIKNSSELHKAMHDAIAGLTVEDVKNAMNLKGSRIYLISRALRRMYAAEKSAKNFNLIGVGVISFRDHRLAKYCAKIGLVA